VPVSAGLEVLDPDAPSWSGVVDALAEVMLNNALNERRPEHVARMFAAARELRGPWDRRMMTGWIDSLLASLGFTATHNPHGEPRTDALAQLVFSDDGAQVVDVDDVGPGSRWVGRLIAARAVLDVDTQSALLAAPPRGELPYDHVILTLYVVVSTLQRHPALGGANR
jgi:hypothetical protein